MPETARTKQRIDWPHSVLFVASVVVVYFGIAMLATIEYRWLIQLMTHKGVDCNNSNMRVLDSCMRDVDFGIALMSNLITVSCMLLMLACIGCFSRVLQLSSSVAKMTGAVTRWLFVACMICWVVMTALAVA